MADHRPDHDARTPANDGVDDAHKWHDAPLAQEIFIVHNQVMRVADRLVAHLGLTASRWLLLGALEHYAEPPTLSELSEDALLSVQNVSRMVASMERDGLVHRVCRQGSGRCVFVSMTDHGRAVKEEARAQARRFSAHFLDGLGADEVARTQAVFDRMIANLERFEQELQAGTGDAE